METNKLTIRLPSRQIQFAKQYSQRHRTSVTRLIESYLQRLEEGDWGPIHPALQEISGVLPEDLDVREEYQQSRIAKHR